MSTLITFGNGGEFAGLTLAWRSIALQHLTDDIIFRQVGDFTENYSMAAQPPYPPCLDGHNIYVENPLGFKITLNPNTISYAFSHAVAPPPIGVGTITVDGLNIKCSHVALSSNSILRGDIDIVYKNITIIGVYSPAMTAGAGISIRRRDYQTSKIFNCRIYGMPVGFILVDYMYNDDKKYLENCITYKCGVGLYLEGANVAGNSVNIKNSCFANSLNNDVVIVTNTNNIITNCADSDNSIASADATKSDNITGIVDGDFLSVDPTNANFLNIDQSSKLYENGTTPSAWNTADIRGLPRPHGSKLLTSIGAFEGLIMADVTVEFVGIPRTGRSPLTVDFTANVSANPEVYSVRGYNWCFDYSVSGSNTWDYTTETNISHVYEGHYGKTFDVALSADLTVV
jgi:hypothetical protein